MLTPKKWIIGSVLCTNFAMASDHGCTVLLCLSNPAGWSSVSQCVSPVKKLFRDLAKGKAFPGCDLQSAGANAENYAKVVNKPYDDCPSGTQAGPKGALIAEGVRITSTKDPIKITGPAYASELTYDKWSMSPKACVTKKIGNVTKCSHGGGGGKDRDATCTTTAVYEKVVWMQAHKPPRAIEVMVDGKIVNTVRF